LLSYCGLDERDLVEVFEGNGSQKIGRYMPGTRLPVTLEPEDLGDLKAPLLLLSHHIGGALITKLRAKRFTENIISPLPSVTVQ
jgi:hypothetical protein